MFMIQWISDLKACCKKGMVTGMATFTMEELANMILVDMGAYKTARGRKKLVTKDLGSCVGVALRDPSVGVGGLIHVMLPHHWENGEAYVTSKYADTGIDEMVRELVSMGARRDRLVAKIAGAAHMITSSHISESHDISSRNLEAVHKKLEELRIPVVAADVGEHWPRTVVFEPESGNFRIHTPGKADKNI